MLNNYRPWGQVDWLFEKTDIERCPTFIGCLSTEDRCTESSVRVREKYGRKADFNYFVINDPICTNKVLTRKKIDKCREYLEDEIGLVGTIEEFDLMCPPFDFIDYIESVVENSKFVILDITSMPKRFFFIAIKKILDHKIENFLVTYAKPMEYGDSETLSGNPDKLDSLPCFPAIDLDSSSHTLVVSIGHSELGLVSAFEEKAPELELQVLFPFPPGPPSIEKNWRFMNSIQSLGFKNKPVDPIRVSAANLSDAYDYIAGISEGNKKNLILAPYGPKPISVAMCLYAIQSGTPVVYTQPRSYNPNYSSGAGRIENGDSATYGYWIVIGGKNLFFDQAFYEESPS